MQVEEPRNLVVVLLDLGCPDIAVELSLGLTFPHLEHGFNAGRAQLAVHAHAVLDR